MAGEVRAEGVDGGAVDQLDGPGAREQLERWDEEAVG